jgi:hypothetical protein
MPALDYLRRSPFTNTAHRCCVHDDVHQRTLAPVRSLGGWNQVGIGYEGSNASSHCRACGVRVEAVPWGIGKQQLTKAYMLFLAHWARKLSWQETAVSFHSTWDKVCRSVEYVVAVGDRAPAAGPDRGHRRR